MTDRRPNEETHYRLIIYSTTLPHPFQIAPGRSAAGAPRQLCGKCFRLSGSVWPTNTGSGSHTSRQRWLDMVPVSACARTRTTPADQRATSVYREAVRVGSPTETTHHAGPSRTPYRHTCRFLGSAGRHRAHSDRHWADRPRRRKREHGGVRLDFGFRPGCPRAPRSPWIRRSLTVRRRDGRGANAEIRKPQEQRRPWSSPSPRSRPPVRVDAEHPGATLQLSCSDG